MEQETAQGTEPEGEEPTSAAWRQEKPTESVAKKDRSRRETSQYRNAVAPATKRTGKRASAPEQAADPASRSRRQATAGDDEAIQVVALGGVRAKYVHNAAVMARGDIVIGSYLLNAHVRTGKRLAVRSGGEERGGSIVGGQVTAAGGIWATRVGSAATDRTVVAVGPAPDVAARLHKLDQGIEFCRTNILRAFRALGLPEIDAAHFKKLIQKTPYHQREPLMKVLRQLKSLTRTREKSLQLRRQLEQEITRGIADAEIKVADAICADTEIYMGDSRYIVPEDMGRAVFFLAEEGVRFRQASVRS